MFLYSINLNTIKTKRVFIVTIKSLFFPNLPKLSLNNIKRRFLANQPHFTTSIYNLSNIFSFMISYKFM